MDITIYIFCYNEEILISHTIKHYKQYLPSAKIIILDNHSTDNSITIANSFGVEIITWGSREKLECKVGTVIRNTIWKNINSGWIIMVDMDEFLYITENELLDELHNGTTILTTLGMDMIGESNYEDLNDINLHEIKKYVINIWESKNVCFNKDYINEINYSHGAHACAPVGKITYSKKVYNIKHMNMLGLPYLIKRIKAAFIRATDDRKMGLATHYTDNESLIIKKYNNAYKTCMSE